MILSGLFRHDRRAKSERWGRSNGSAGALDARLLSLEQQLAQELAPLIDGRFDVDGKTSAAASKIAAENWFLIALDRNQ